VYRKEKSVDTLIKNLHLWINKHVVCPHLFGLEVLKYSFVEVEHFSLYKQVATHAIVNLDLCSDVMLSLEILDHLLTVVDGLAIDLRN